jgi:hypothetical protein
MARAVSEEPNGALARIIDLGAAVDIRNGYNYDGYNYDPKVAKPNRIKPNRTRQSGGGVRRKRSQRHDRRRSPPPHPPTPPGTKRTRRVPSPVLSGHAASLSPY